MVLLIDTNTADGPRHPTVGERLRPIRIHEKARHVAFRRAGGNIEFDRGLCRNSEQSRKHVFSDSHELPLPNSDCRRDYQRQESGSIGGSLRAVATLCHSRECGNLGATAAILAKSALMRE